MHLDALTCLLYHDQSHREDNGGLLCLPRAKYEKSGIFIGGSEHAKARLLSSCLDIKDVLFGRG